MIKTKKGYYAVIYALFTSAFFYLIFPYFADYGNIFFSEKSLSGSYFVYTDSNGSSKERIFHNYDLSYENGVYAERCDFYDKNDRYNEYSDCISGMCDYEESCCNFSFGSVKISFTAKGKTFVFFHNKTLL